MTMLLERVSKVVNMPRPIPRTNHQLAMCFYKKSRLRYIPRLGPVISVTVDVAVIVRVVTGAKVKMLKRCLL